MPNDKLLSFLGLARRAGKVQLGHDPVLDSLRSGRARLVLLASDLSSHSSGGILRAAEEEGVPAVTLKHTVDEMGAALGKRAGAVSVEDAGFAQKLETLCADR
ncbi:MAG TPA: 50S ribosomal protein L7ae [Ruminococcaceae bacterium]|jgi:ribosomal protein L7Ae-like RNA K-turn-binding protein|nr:50S ribosomal protein L7ae [Oscillospiraceae bacterium]HCC02265.1 50S ribosomal protein L7ae [Oscillospiraceae bacterium]HCM23937.1 50S ribosomal protein L7ae [Oscillospiraceae bacterium]